MKHYNRSASTGSSFEARHAGYQPKNIPVIIAKITAIISPYTERKSGSVDPNGSNTITASPTITPMSDPRSVRIKLSRRNCQSTEL